MWRAETHGAAAPFLRLDAAGERLFVVAGDEIIALDLAMGDRITSFDVPTAYRCAVGPRGEYLWVSTVTGDTRALHLATSELACTKRRSPGRATLFTVVDDRVVVGDWEGNIHVHDCAAAGDGLVVGAARVFSRGALRDEGAVLLYGRRQRTELHRPGGDRQALALPGLEDAAFVGSDRLAAIGAQRRELLVFDLGSGVVAGRPGRGLSATCVGPVGGDRVIVGYRDGTVRLWDLDTETAKVIGSSRRHVMRVAPSPDGRLVAAGMVDGQVLVWQIGHEQPVFAGAASGKMTFAMAWSPDNRWLAAGDNDGLRVFDLAKGGVVFRNDTTLTSKVGGLAFSGDGRRLVQASHYSPLLRFWATDSWDTAAYLGGHSHVLDTVQCTADGAMMLTVDHEGFARRWRAR